MNQSEITIELDDINESFSTIVTKETTLLNICEMIKEAEFFKYE
jgi:hypothetical protein